ncbi:MAG TPA: DNA-formamidopyrimidine glycosylase family protein [Mycobacteriales bacterium]|nr:DNA-formamidopyrimidine glycosylase family protein [Mycobacteriales bacterium]
MPEGHILHRLARDQQDLVGQVLSASSPQGRFAQGSAALDGRRLELVEAYGKHLHHRAAAGAELHVHLGMQGKWIPLDAERPPRAQVRLRLTGSGVAWDLIAPATCRLLEPGQWEALVATLGPDPLRPDADPDEVWRRVHAYRGALGAALLDQSVVAGVGNVFRAEALFAVRLHPAAPAAALDRVGFDRLWQVLVAMMRRAVDDNRIITVPDAPKTVPETESRMVYKQQLCRRCGTGVVTSSVGGRTAYACPICQPC